MFTVACLMMFYQVYQSKTPKRTALRLIILVSVSDFINCLLNYFAYFFPFTSINCDILGFLKDFNTWIEMLLYSLISLLSYLTLKNFGAFAISRIVNG